MAGGARLHCGGRIWPAGGAGHDGMGRWLLCWVSAVVATTWWCSAPAGTLQQLVTVVVPLLGLVCSWAETGWDGGAG